MLHISVVCISSANFVFSIQRPKILANCIDRNLHSFHHYSDCRTVSALALHKDFERYLSGERAHSSAVTG